MLHHCTTKNSPTYFHNVISQTGALNVPHVAQAWQNELGVNTEEDEWDVIWNLTRKL